MKQFPVSVFTVLFVSKSCKYISCNVFYYLVNFTSNSCVGECVMAADASKSDPVRFIASQKNSPDPPSWLHFSQDDNYLQDGYLYGTPEHLTDPVEIEAIT